MPHSGGRLRGERLLARRTVAGGLTVALLASLLALVLPAVAAQADTGGYADAGMPCEWFPQSSSGPAHTKWCQDFDWGPTPSTLFAGQESIDPPSTISPRGFGYRNCTDYVAVKLGFDSQTVHGNASQWKDQLPPANVTNYPTIGAVAWWGTEVDDGLGHVAVVLSLNPDGSGGRGVQQLPRRHLRHRTISSRAADAFLHVRDQGAPGGLAWVPGYHPVLPAPPDGTNARGDPCGTSSTEARPAAQAHPLPGPLPGPLPRPAPTRRSWRGGTVRPGPPSCRSIPARSCGPMPRGSSRRASTGPSTSPQPSTSSSRERRPRRCGRATS